MTNFIEEMKSPFSDYTIMPMQLRFAKFIHLISHSEDAKELGVENLITHEDFKEIAQ